MLTLDADTAGGVVAYRPFFSLTSALRPILDVESYHPLIQLLDWHPCTFALTDGHIGDELSLPLVLGLASHLSVRFLRIGK
jgi:hypothetical protein